MLETNPQEITEAIEHLGDGKHQMKDIENQIIKDRHFKALEDKKKRRIKKNAVSHS